MAAGRRFIRLLRDGDGYCPLACRARLEPVDVRSDSGREFRDLAGAGEAEHRADDDVGDRERVADEVVVVSEGRLDYPRWPVVRRVPLGRGSEPGLVEILHSGYLDDLPPIRFIKKSPNSHGFVNPRDVEQMWRDQFDWAYREMDYAVFPITRSDAA